MEITELYLLFRSKKDWYSIWVVLIGPPPKSYAVHPLDLIRSTPCLIGPGYPLSLKHHPHKAVYVSAILFNVGVDFERSNLKPT